MAPNELGVPFANPFQASADAAAQPNSSAATPPATAAPGAAFGLVFQAPDPETVLPRREKSKRSHDADDASQDGQRTGDSKGERTSEKSDKHEKNAKNDKSERSSTDQQADRGDKNGAADSSKGDRRADADAGSDARDESTDSDGSARETDDASDSDRTPRRRRRGGRGRRSKGGQDDSNQDNSHEENSSDADDDATSDADDSDAGDDNSTDEGSSRKRTRRRRRSGSNAASDNDDPNTVTKVREPRKAKDEVTSIKGSTRLEAKKQRRREGREAGRRRTIITEAEFLARRESVDRVMVVREQEGRTQIGVLEDGVLAEHYVSRHEQASSMAGNVYLGRVQNVLPSMEAAFVDIGRGRNAVLYAGEVNWDAAGLDNQPKRIEHALKAGETVLVQVTKDPIGHKGARLTSQVSLPGRFLVYVPGNSMTGISRKLPDTERSRLKKILKEIVPADAGVIVRTAAEGASEEELRADVERLSKMWENIQKKAASGHAPSLLHGEPDLTVRVIRDVFNEDFSKMVVSGERAWKEVHSYISDVAPDLLARLEKHEGEDDVFAKHRIDEQLAKAMDRKVWLPSGGSLVIDRTEAMTVVDVNTGKFVGSGGNLEETVTKNNIEAAEEIVRQLRLRDIGGIIVVDFIDMVLESNRELVVRRLLECLGRDRTKHQVAEVTSLGLVQMTRKRVGSGLVEVFSEQCEHCHGRGIIIHDHPVENRDINGNETRKGRGRKNRDNNGGQNGHQGDKRAEKAEKDNGFAQIAAAAHAAAVSAGEKSQTPQSDAASTPADSTPERAPESEQSDAARTDSAADNDTTRPQAESASADAASATSGTSETAAADEAVQQPKKRKSKVTGRIIPKAALLAAAAAEAENAPLPSEDDDAETPAAAVEATVAATSASVEPVVEAKPKKRRRAATSAGNPTTAGQAQVMTVSQPAATSAAPATSAATPETPADAPSDAAAGSDTAAASEASAPSEAETTAPTAVVAAEPKKPAKRPRRRAGSSAGAPVNLQPVDLTAVETSSAPLTSVAAEAGSVASDATPEQPSGEEASAGQSGDGAQTPADVTKPVRKKRARVTAAAGAPGASTISTASADSESDNAASATSEASDADADEKATADE